MAKQDREISIGFIGCGAVHFNSDDLFWDHSRRLHALGGVKVVAIVDPDQQKAHQVLQTQQTKSLTGGFKGMYDTCRVFADVPRMLKEVKPEAMFVGAPPFVRGSLDNDMELQLVRAGIHLLVEKPLSVLPPSVFTEYALAMDKEIKDAGVVVSVGYMFRYHAAVRKMREVLAAHGRPVISFDARYNIPYTGYDEPLWHWNIGLSGGPMVEAATHLFDLARYLGGEIDEGSVYAASVLHSHAAGNLSKINIKYEADVADKYRPARSTKAIWRYSSAGGLGSLTHVHSLHGSNLAATLQITVDGLLLTLEEPFTRDCKLRIRGRKDDPNEEEVLQFGDCDCYMEEIRTFLAAVRTGDTSYIASPYADAAKTYSFTWAVRLQSEKQSAV